MINPIHIIAVLSVLAGWHLDEIDACLIEANRESLAALNIPAPEPVLIDTDERGRPIIRREQ